MVRFSQSFTLIEIMVVVLIIGLLAGLVGINVIRYFDRARERTARAQLTMIEQALELYKIENGRYPTTDEGLSALARGGYIKGKQIPKDPWGSDYYYISDGSTFTLKSPGPDKVIGTQDDISVE
jgi:general secretion pathway protein G